MSDSQNEADLAELGERAIRLEAIRLAMAADIRTNRPIETAAAIARFILTGFVPPAPAERHDA